MRSTWKASHATFNVNWTKTHTAPILTCIFILLFYTCTHKVLNLKACTCTCTSMGGDTLLTVIPLKHVTSKGGSYWDALSCTFTMKQCHTAQACKLQSKAYYSKVTTRQEQIWSHLQYTSLLWLSSSSESTCCEGRELLSYNLKDMTNE